MFSKTTYTFDATIWLILITANWFLYRGEANVQQDNLDSFLDVAAELKLKGLTTEVKTANVKEGKGPKEKIHAVFKKEASKSPQSSFYEQSLSNKQDTAGGTVVALKTQFS